MSTTSKVLIGLFGGLLLLTIVSVSSVIGINNDLVRQEASIQAQYKQNQNNYSNYFNKLQEVAQVPSMYKNDLKEVYTAAISGRYGKDGSKAVFQFLKEQNPNLDASMYTKIQQVIESGRNSFEADQKTLLERKRIYQISLQEFPGNIIASTLGFPKIDLDKIDIVINDATQQAFDTKKAGPIQLTK